MFTLICSPYIRLIILQAWKNWRAGTTSKLVDPLVTSTSPATQIMRCIHVGLLCVQENVANRPTMASVVLMLSSSSMTLSVPTSPAFLMHSRTASDTSSQSNNSSGVTRRDETAVRASVNEVSISELFPR